MPRPTRPPTRIRALTWIVDPHELAVVAGLKVSDVECRRLIRQVRLLITAYHAAWSPEPARGRRRETRRDVLIAEVALAFQRHTSWTDPREYRTHLHDFLMRVFIATNITAPPTRVLRILPPHLRLPR